MDDARDIALRVLFELAERNRCDCWVCVLLRMGSKVGQDLAATAVIVNAEIAGDERENIPAPGA